MKTEYEPHHRCWGREFYDTVLEREKKSLTCPNRHGQCCRYLRSPLHLLIAVGDQLWEGHFFLLKCLKLHQQCSFLPDSQAPWSLYSEERIYWSYLSTKCFLLSSEDEGHISGWKAKLCGQIIIHKLVNHSWKTHSSTVCFVYIEPRENALRKCLPMEGNQL